jgi:DNA-binding CsgD family transcriptional regulator/PAS domain-containing protein
MNEPADPNDVIRVQNVAAVRTWLRSRRRGPMPTSFWVALARDFELHQQAMSALASMRVQLPHVLTSGQDQIFVLDREQRMVAFFGNWPKEAPWRLQDILGKRKRDIFGPDVAAIHEAAGLRALNGEEASFEWTVPKLPVPVHLSTAASPLRDDSGQVAGVLLVTRNITALKQAQIEIERALREKTHQLLEVEQALRRVAAALQPPHSQVVHSKTSGLHTNVLSKREHQVLTLLRGGARLRSIAQTLGISIETVRRHVKAMFRKTGVHSQEELVKVFFGTVEQ